MNLLLPYKVTLTSTSVGKKGRVRFVYEEHFRQSDLDEALRYTAPERRPSFDQMMENTMHMVKQMVASDITVERIKKRVFRMSGTIDRERFGTMMTTEFLCWSNIGNMTLAQLLMTAASRGVARLRSC